jgi:succinoglycan biosynthesis transport protein ExoP
MSTSARSIINLQQIRENLVKHRWLWIAPTLACTALAICYAGTRSTKWKAVQVVMLRNESSDAGQHGQGDFATPEALKLHQETVVQSGRTPAVVEAALKELGPENGDEDPSYPTPEVVEATSSKIILAPPKGSEFGKANEIYITTEGKTPQRAKELNSALVKQLSRRLQELRAAKAGSLRTEYEQAVALAQADVDEATLKLEKMENLVGRDIGELRTLNEGATGNSNLREGSNQIKQELRAANSKYEELVQLAALLTGARQDPNRLIEAPSRLFELQPGLKKMKEGLVDAQIKTANLLGRMTPSHPDVLAARMAETEVKQELTIELDNLIGSLNADMRVLKNQTETLQTQLNDVEQRMNRLAGLRAPYSNLVSDVKRTNDKLAEEHKKLANARSSEATAFKTSVLSTRDDANAGTSPVGPSAKLVVLGGALGGFLLGMGLIFVTVPIGQMWGRRWSDYASSGRRAVDRTTPTASGGANVGRRGSDPVPAVRRASDAPDGNRRASDAPRTDRRAADAPNVAAEETTVATLPLTNVNSTSRRGADQRTRRPHDMNNGQSISARIKEAKPTAEMTEQSGGETPNSKS